MKKIVNWGIAGLGKIARRFARDLVNHAGNAKLYSIASREFERAKCFSEEYQCENVYDSYHDLAQDNVIDIVYIATIHPFHKQLAELFLKNGKSVFVEKPAFTNVKDWNEMSFLAKKNNLLLLEAMKSVVFPAYKEIKKIIKENQLKITEINASFGHMHGIDKTHQIFNRNLSGGATLDVGVYPLWLYVDLCLSSSQTIGMPQISIGNEYNDLGIDESVEFFFAHGTVGKLSASITYDLPREAIIAGKNFKIVIHEKWWNPTNKDRL